MPYLAVTLRLSVALVLLAAVVGKVRAGRAARAELGQAIRRLGAPTRLVGPVAHAVVPVEFGIVVLLWLPGTALLGCLAALALFGAFSAGVARLVALDAGVPCRCFGAARGLRGGHVVRNLALSALAAGAALATVVAPSNGLPAVALAGTIATAVPIAAAFVRWDDLAVLAAGLPEPATDEKGR
jgi:hypothetical protein